LGTGDGEEGRRPMARKTTKKPLVAATLVDFNFQERTYQVDPNRKKVYRQFVEIETSKAWEIFSVWRSQHAAV
jgi:hypothetical protein